MRLTHKDHELGEIHRTGNVCLDITLVMSTHSFLPLGGALTTPANAAASSSGTPNVTSRVTLTMSITIQGLSRPIKAHSYTSGASPAA